VTDHRDDGPTTFVRQPKSPQSEGDLRTVAPALTILWHYDLSRVGQVAPLGRRRTEVGRGTAPFDPNDTPLSRAAFMTIDHLDGAVTLTPSNTSKTSVVVDGQALSAPLHLDALRLKRGVVLLLADSIVVCLHQVRTPRLRGDDLGFVGTSDAMEDVRRQISRVADLDVPVLIQGQTGTGKELVAKAIATSARTPATPAPFVAVNMTRLLPTTAAADLFGYEKGAFTGAASDRPGYFVEADGGTLFLDEIGDALVDVQKMLLRVVEDGRVRPLGGRRDRAVKVRLLTATDKDLDADVNDGSFDDALYNRIRGYRIYLPPLSERREDIGSLFVHFLRLKLSATGELHRLAPCQVDERPWLSAADFARIAGAAYPGNLRDLGNLANEIVVDSRNKPFAVFGAEAERILSAPPSALPANNPSPTSRRRIQFTDVEIASALRLHHYDVKAAAKSLGISRTTIYARAELVPGLLRSADDLTDNQILDAHAHHAGNIAAMAEELAVPLKPLRLRLQAALKKPR
jgi:two-component system nitrogen regulation response regulator GlnG